MHHSLAHQTLTRVGQSLPGSGSVQGRVSADFTVNGASLLHTLIRADGGHPDFMGCFVQGYPEANRGALGKLLAVAAPDTEDDRVLLYICAECGDIGCGAYAVRIQHQGNEYVWDSFAYVNGYEPPRLIAALGPFAFAEDEYQRAVEAASVL